MPNEDMVSPHITEDLFVVDRDVSVVEVILL